MEGERGFFRNAYQRMQLIFLAQGGRELAEVSRPNTKEPPILTLSDGTVF